ncbi:helix-turn-helix domain-containing protein [Telmatospirillum sp.]|uniref:helix-turn-helix transcriptional regulator n=1 Tax=Telmatospirillum sp. TaxID=2079197 RepID=UPI00283E02FB|nr:helix-turn-helix domain-containing protein [Telmatospirillum sp.]MDR3436633.1 helix-turn-helix domain-containing protein [Telmatospirillum sp.]
MRDRLAEIAARYLRTHEAARLLGISPRTLEKYRCHGSGPMFRKLGGRVVYAIDDLEAWADQAACRSTSDPHYDEARAAGRGDAASRVATAHTHR